MYQSSKNDSKDDQKLDLPSTTSLLDNEENQEGVESSYDEQKKQLQPDTHSLKPPPLLSDEEKEEDLDSVDSRLSSDDVTPRDQLLTAPNILAGKKPLSVERGKQIMDLISKGDTSFFDEIDGIMELDDGILTFGEPAEVMQMGEWGLAGLEDEAFLIYGSGGAVNWASVLDVGATCLAHVHPYSWKRGIRTEAKKDFMPLTDVFNNHPHRGMLVLPSTGDIQFCQRFKLDTHIVYTPYCLVFNSNEAQHYITNPGSGLDKHIEGQKKDKTERLSFVLSDFSAKSVDEVNVIECKMAIQSAGSTIMEKKATVPAEGGAKNAPTLTDWS